MHTDEHGQPHPHAAVGGATAPALCEVAPRRLGDNVYTVVQRRIYLQGHEDAKIECQKQCDGEQHVLNFDRPLSNLGPQGAAARTIQLAVDALRANRHGEVGVDPVVVLHARRVTGVRASAASEDLGASCGVRVS
eukprot:312543-Prymnesium_polylepis.2